MSRDLAVVITHGIGSQRRGFSEALVEELSRRLERKHRKSPERVAWKEIYWQDIVEPRQTAYLRRAQSTGQMDAIGLRRFVVSALGDAAAYQNVPSAHNTTYREIHGRIRADIAALHGEIGASDPPPPLIVMAHSLGGHVMSNYIWDMQKAGPPGAPSAFERLETLAGIVTFGCNIPLFTFAYETVEPIAFPPPTLPPELAQRARWLNFFDPDDILGYPLKPLCPAYRRVVSKDIPINVGGIFTSWNPASHTEYWTDNDFTAPVARFLARFL